MMKLTRQIAESVVERMMDAVPYNINIMNNKGIIIASGDVNRIGKLHEGAVDAINRNKLNFIYEDNGGAKPGVNMPIYFSENLMGVIGISGSPKEVVNFASIVKATAELLIKQEYMFNKRRIKEQLQEEFLYQWSYLGDEYDENFMQRANVLGIDLDIKRIAVIVIGKDKQAMLKTIKRYICECEYIIPFNADAILVFMRSDKNTFRRILNLYDVLKHNVKIGVGLEENTINNSVHQALRAIEINDKLSFEYKICNYMEFKFIDIIARNNKLEDSMDIIERLESSGNLELIRTLIIYIVLNCEGAATSERLHIHRNSLSYRLRKIHKITGKDPKNVVDLLELFVACILYKLN